LLSYSNQIESIKTLFTQLKTDIVGDKWDAVKYLYYESLLVDQKGGKKSTKNSATKKKQSPILPAIVDLVSKSQKMLDSKNTIYKFIESKSKEQYSGNQDLGNLGRIARKSKSKFKTSHRSKSKVDINENNTEKSKKNINNMKRIKDNNNTDSEKDDQ